MSKITSVPDAWDDDYEATADAKTTSPPIGSTTAVKPRSSRAERKALHEEANKQLWESADNPETFHYVETRTAGVALTSELKPALKVLSRKPTKPTNLEQGSQSMNVHDDDIDSEEEERREQARLLKERMEKAAQERAEKQRKYAERREQLFGPSPTLSTGSSGRDSPTKRSGGRTRAKGEKRGGATAARDSQHSSSADQSPAPPGRRLYDPGTSDKPGSVYLERRKNGDSTAGAQKPIRNPRGPDGSGKGGFGFAPRGNKAGP